MKKYTIVYQQIIDNIDKAIYSNEKLPTEKNLAQEYNVSVNTIRKALNSLIEKGYIVSRQGSGYYISNKKNFRRLKNISLQSTLPKGTVKSDVLKFGFITATEELASKLGIEIGEAIYEVKRIRSIEGEAYQIENTFIPVKILPKLSKEVFQNSFYEYVQEECQLKIDHAIKEISAINIAKEDAQYLKRKEGQATLVVENYGFLSNGEQFEYSFNIHNDEKFSINVNSK